MKNNKGFAPILILVAVLAVLAIGGGAYYMGKSSTTVPQNTQDNNYQPSPANNLVGGDKDEHGCIGSAGYSWCVVKNKCLRTWEEKCEVSTTNTQDIKFTFPTTGSILTEGQTYNISWAGLSISSATYGVFLEDKNGNTVGLTPETGALISGNSISWTVPYLENFGEKKVLPGDGFRIVIFPKGKYPQEASYSPVFKIVK